jgi:hypothetical protein
MAVRRFVLIVVVRDLLPGAEIPSSFLSKTYEGRLLHSPQFSYDQRNFTRTAARSQLRSSRPLHSKPFNAGKSTFASTTTEVALLPKDVADDSGKLFSPPCAIQAFSQLRVVVTGEVLDLLTPRLRAVFDSRRILLGSRPRSIQDVDSSPIRFPSRNAGCEVGVGICQPPVMLFFEFIFGRSRIRIAALPEGDDKSVALLVGRKLLEVGPFLVGDNPRDVFPEPFFVNLFDRRI